MKKILLCLFVGLVAFSASAASYSFMQFTDKDGNSQYVSANGLTITIDGASLVVTNSSGDELTFEAADLVSMKFTNSNGSNAIKTISFENGEVEAYGLDGLYAGKYQTVDEAKNSLSNGVYVLKNGQGETIKIVVSR